METDAVLTVEPDEKPDYEPEKETEPQTETEPQQPEPEMKSESDEILDQIWNAELVIRRKESVIEGLREDLKIAKSQYDEAVHALRELAQLKHDGGHPLFQGQPGDSVTTKPAEPGSSPDTTADEFSSDWRTESISTLLEPPIAGMGPKKVELLTDLVKTLGDFEDLRARVGRDADTLSKLLPKGFGEKMVEELENRQLKFIADFQSRVDDGGDDGGKRDPVPMDEITNVEEVITSLTEQERQLLARTTELENAGSNPDEDWTQYKHDSDAWQNGFDTGTAGEEISECIYMPGEKQDDWLRGWCAANSEWEESEEETGTESETESESKPETVEAVDDLADL